MTFPSSGAVRIKFLGGANDGTVIDLSPRCSCCGQAMPGTRSVAPLPSYELHVVDGEIRAEYVGVEELTLEELLADAAA